MKVPMQNVLNALNLYIDNDALQIAKTMPITDQFIFGLKIGLIREKAQSFIKSLSATDGAKMMDLIDEEGHVDIDAVYNAAKFSLSKMPDKKIRAFGFTLTETDIDKLYHYAKG